MKKIILSMTAMLMMTAVSTSAQNLGSLLKSAASTVASKTAEKSGNSTLSTIANAAINLLGTSNVSADDITGTWSYSKPAVAFESKNALTSIGGSAVSGSIETKLASYLTKAGFTAGKVKLTLNSDNSGSVYFGGKYVPCQWSVSGTDLTLKVGTSASTTLASASKLSSKLAKFTQVKFNVKKSGTTLQIAAKSTQLVKLLSGVASAAGKASSSLSSLTSLTNNIDGVYLGLKMTK